MPERAKPLTDADVETMAQALDSGELYADDLAVISWFATYGPELLKRALETTRQKKELATLREQIALMVNDGIEMKLADALRENTRLTEALAQARDGAFEKIGSTELIRGLLRLLREGYGPGGGYYEPHQRAAAAEALLAVGWGKRDG